MNKVIYVLALCILFSSISIMAVTDSPQLSIYLNNQKLAYSESTGKPFIDEANRIQVPLRITLEAFGAKVTWDATKMVATVKKGAIEIIVPVGKKYIIKNNEKMINDTAAILKNGRIYLPIRIVMEAFGCSVNWSAETSSVLIIYDESANIVSSIPKKYDLRNFSKVTTVKNQYDTGACWAFSAIGSIESVLMPRSPYDFSEDHLSLSHGYNLSQAEGGDYRIALAYLTRWSGPVLEKEDPFGDSITKQNLVATKHIQEAQIIADKDYSGIKKAILLYGGVQTSLRFTINAHEEMNQYYNAETFSYYYTGKEIDNHNVVIVGWDDNYSKDNFMKTPKNNGAFICKNSFGTEFGDNGYLYISYEDVYIGTDNLIYSKVEKNTNYDNIYQTDWLGWVGRIGYGTDTAYFSNVYKTKQKEKLSAASFYATGPSSSYEVYYVEKFKSSADLNKRTFLSRGLLDNAGYYTITFANPPTVEGSFAIIIKITTPKSELPVAAEYYKDVSWLKDVTISDGEGYLSQDGQNWDRTENELGSNICLKAFTNAY